jgi:hypothetical protein
MAKYIARKIKRVAGIGEKILWELCPPLEGYGFIITSAVINPYSGAETYIFPANSQGEMLGWLELKGSYRGGLSHSAALIRAGYIPEGDEVWITKTQQI